MRRQIDPSLPGLRATLLAGSFGYQRTWTIQEKFCLHTQPSRAVSASKRLGLQPLKRKTYFFLPFFLAGAGFLAAAFLGAGFLATGFAGAFAGAAFFAAAGGAPFSLAGGAGCFAGAAGGAGVASSAAGAGAGAAAPASAFLGLRPRFFGA